MTTSPRRGTALDEYRMAAVCNVTFRVTAPVQTGHVVAVIGSAPALGEWDVSKALVLECTSDRCVRTNAGEGVSRMIALNTLLLHAPLSRTPPSRPTQLPPVVCTKACRYQP